MRIVGTSLLMMVLIAGCDSVQEPVEAAPESTVAVSSELTAAQCNAYNGNVSACNAAGCAYYACSNKCYPPGTSNCDAGCTSYCPTCRSYDGNVSACNAAGCAYYYCSNQCHPSGTSNCDAGCTSYCTTNCRAYDGNVSACDAAGCAYYACSNQCQPPGTSNCAAGCTSYCTTGNTYNYASVCPSPSGGRYLNPDDVDAWSFWKCECTSYAADKLNERGIAFNNYYKGVHWGDASNWVTAAQSAGVSYSTTPRVGDVAWWNGHVAYVDSVNADGSANISEYNYGNAWDYHTRSSIRATYYIHF